MPTCRSAALSLLLLLIIGLLPVGLFAIGFQVSHTYAVAKNPTYAIAADFNEDGKMDLAVACFGSGTNGLIDILLGNGDGSFQKAHAINIGQDVLSVVSGDFNHDGHVDLAAIFGGTVSVVLGNGDGTFGPLTGYNVGGGTIEAIATGDINRDGNVDLITTNKSPGNLSVLLGKGDGTFQPVVNTRATASPSSVAVADLNGDGKLDAVVADNSAGGAYVLLGNGDGTFHSPVGYSTSTPLADVTIADFNGDHKLDLLTCAYSNFTIGVADVFLGNGDGTFQAPVTYTAGTAAPISISAVDMDTDGKLDAVVVGEGGVTVLRGNGDGSFQPSVGYVAGEFPRTPAIADFNGDNKPDVAVPNNFDYNVSVLINRGTGALRQARTYDSGPLASGLTVGDFNNDGIKDVAVSNEPLMDAADDGVSVMLGNPDGTFQPRIITTTGDLPAIIGSGDFNKDGNLDVAIANEIAATITVLFGNGDGTFQVGPSFSAFPIGAVVADVNRDGNLDILVAQFSLTSRNNNLIVFLGNGDGTFQQKAKYFSGNATDGLAIGDLNGDGIVDVAVNDYIDTGLTEDVYLFLGNGDGTFQSLAPLSIGGYAANVAIADLNNDGKADLLVNDLLNLVYLAGNGDGTFQPANNISTGIGPILVGDVNGDGNLDIVGNGTSKLAVLLGKGDGTVQPPLIYTTGFFPITLTDVNGDDLLDLISLGANDFSVVINGGTFPPLR